MATASPERLRERDGFRDTVASGREPPPLPRPSERPLWQVIGLLYAGIVLLAALVMTLAFSVAQALA